MKKSILSKTTIASAIVASLVISGCSSTETEKYQAQQQVAKEKSFQAEERKFATVPDWFLNQPANDDSGMYAVGTATSNNLQFSLNTAKLNAEFDLAKNLNQEVSGRERAYMHSGTNGNVETDAESVVTKFVDSADIVGLNAVKKEVALIDGKYVAYVLLHLSYEEQAKILAKKSGDTTRSSAKQAYDEVEAEVLRRAEARHKLETDKVLNAVKEEKLEADKVNTQAQAPVTQSNSAISNVGDAVQSIVLDI